MKYIILGQPRSGKTTLARMISEEKNIPIICTDKLRREWGFHEPWKGYDTEISPKRKKEFYNKLLDLYNSYESVILEGSAINPKDINIFKYDAAVLLAKVNTNPQDMLKLSRTYDNDWTTKREDEYLLNLFEYYCNYARIWIKENRNLVVDTTNFYEGLNIAKERLYKEGEINDKS